MFLIRQPSYKHIMSIYRYIGQRAWGLTALVMAFSVFTVVRAQPYSVGAEYRAKLHNAGGESGATAGSARLGLSAPKPPVSQPPEPEEWMRHAREDLGKFWFSTNAWGIPAGNFPSFRGNDGAAIDPMAPPAEFDSIPASEPWLKGRVGRQYARMIGRQIYVYCVFYQLTGDERALELAKKGLDYMMTYMYNDNGFFYTWRELLPGGPSPGPSEDQIISQDISYALLGPAMYYYITRDPEVLATVVKCKNYVMANYSFRDGRGLRWIRKSYRDFDELHTPVQEELVAQLDQINAYMLLLSRIVPPEVSLAWRRDMIHLADVIRTRYYSEEFNVFWGRVDRDGDKRLGSPHVDFGHTIKTLWMLYLIGEQHDRSDLSHFAEERARKVLAEAFYPAYNTWIEKKLEGGALGLDRVWWVHCELDQAAATFMLKDPHSYRTELSATYRYWREHFVDQTNGEVWHSLVGEMPGTPAFIKAHLWKNGFHSLEHALVGYVTAAAMYRKPAKLWFAFAQPPPDDMIHPYLFRGQMRPDGAGSEFASPLLKGLTRQAYLFTDVRP